MQGPDRLIFRTNAIQHYARVEEKSTTLQFISWPVIALLWGLLGLFFVGCVLAWFGEIPTYVTGQGEVLNHTMLHQGSQTLLQHDSAVAIIFLPPRLATQLHIGLSVQITIGSSGLQMQSQIEKLEPGITSPYAVHQRYGCDAKCSLFLTQPSIVVLVKLQPNLATTYAGSIVSAQIKVGSQRIISLIPGVGSVIGK